jgi:hypothetical protein
MIKVIMPLYRWNLTQLKRYIQCTRFLLMESREW